MACPYSATVPEVELPEVVRKAAERGTVIHGFLEHQGSVDYQIDTLDDFPEYREFCEKIPLEKTAGQYTQFQNRELKFVYNITKRTARILTLNKEARDYGKTSEDEVSGTADVVIPGFSQFEVWDYKTGKSVKDYLPAGGNKQLLIAALCLSKTLYRNADSCVLGIQHVYETKVKKEAVVKSHKQRVDKFDLLEFEEALQASYETACKTPKKRMPGPHCKYCPAVDCKFWQRFNKYTKR